MRLPRAWLPWLPVLLATAVFSSALHASFQFDDWRVVLEDPRVASLAAWWESMPGMRALLKFTYALNHEWDAAPAGFRAVNIALHALNAALVFVLARQLAQRLRVADATGAAIIATVTGLVFALHPVQAESVTYISGRSNVLATLGCLLALLAWLRGREPGAAWGWMLLAALCQVAALAGKETAAVLPLAMLLCLAGEHWPARRDLIAPLVLCALVVALFMLAWPHLPYDYLLRTSLDTRGLLANLAVQAQGVSYLVGQLFLWNRLNADPMLQPAAAFTPVVLLQGAVLAAALVAGLLALRRRPWLGFGILWFFLWLAPTNSLLARLDVANDRQLYFAIVGPAWLLGVGIAHARRWAPQAVLLLAVALSYGATVRNRVYATETIFWRDVVAKSPHNLRAWNNLGMALAVECQPAEAAQVFEEAIRRDPDDPRPQVNLALLQRGELPGVPEACRATTDFL
jgi:hypothetical protein